MPKFRPPLSVMPLPRVSVVAPPEFWSMIPAPLMAMGALVVVNDSVLVKVSVPPRVKLLLSTSPLVMLTVPLGRFSVPPSVTPLSVPPEVPFRTALPAVVMVPPVMVPPSRFQVPVVLVNARVLPALLSEPVMLTVPPVLLNVLRLMPAVVNEPPMLRAPLVTVMVPAALLQEPPRLSVPPVVSQSP